MIRRAELEPVRLIDRRNQLAAAAWSIFREMQERFPGQSFIAPGLATGNADIRETLQ